MEQGVWAEWGGSSVGSRVDWAQKWVGSAAWHPLNPEPNPPGPMQTCISNIKLTHRARGLTLGEGNIFSREASRSQYSSAGCCHCIGVGATALLHRR